MPTTSFAVATGEWEHLLTTVEANQTDLVFLSEPSTQLLAVLEGAKGASIRQDTFKSQFQQATRDLEGFLTQGRELATRLRNGIRMQYGLRGEKLTEFGLQPRRRPRTKAKAKPAPAAAPDNAGTGA